MRLRNTVLATVLSLSSVTAVAALDLTPPAVPNPYNTSEGRAIRDHLQDNYRVKAADNLTLPELQHLYRKTWNDLQEKRLFAENPSAPVDQAWAKAFAAEQEALLRDKWTGIAKEQGITVPTGASAEQIRLLIAQAQKEQEQANEAKRQAENAKRREAIAQQIAAQQPRGEVPKSTASDRALALTPAEKTTTWASDDNIRGAVRAFTDKPALTAVERESIDAQAEGLIRERNNFMRSYTAQLKMKSDTGLEIWLGTQPDEGDSEKMIMTLFCLNLSTENYDLKKATLSFIGSKHNTDMTAKFFNSVNSLSTARLYLGTFYNDPEQQIFLDEMDVDHPYGYKK